MPTCIINFVLLSSASLVSSFIVHPFQSVGGGSDISIIASQPSRVGSPKYDGNYCCNKLIHNIISGSNNIISTSSLHAFRGSDYNSHDKDDDDDGDDEPPEISTSPQEFLYRMQQREQQNILGEPSNSNDNIPSSIPSSNKSKRSQTQKVRPSAFGTSSKSKNSLSSNIKGGSKGKGGDALTSVYVCTNCGSEYVQWHGKCGTCLEWNTIQEYTAKRGGSIKSSSASVGKARGGMFLNARQQQHNGFQKSGSSWLDGIDTPYNSDNSYNLGGRGPVRVTDVYQDILSDTNIKEGESWEDAFQNGSREHRTLVPDDSELNAVLGGGIMPGSICLVGGDPGMSMTLLCLYDFVVCITHTHTFHIVSSFLIILLGVGKSTLLLQMAGSVASIAERSLQYQGVGMGPPKPSESSRKDEDEDDTKKQIQNKGGGGPVVYISGEENANQIASRALRLGIHDPELLLWCETDADIIVDTVVNSMYDDSSAPSFFDDDESSTNKAPLPLSKLPSLVVIDSIQTMLCDAAGSSAAGGITQVRECVGLFLRLAKSTGVPIMLVGHVTKNGDVAGPRTVEHMVDCVLYLEGGGLLGGSAGSGVESGGGVSSLRVLRAAKNRFGSAEEVGVYEMGRGGRLIPISDPSSFFLSTRLDNADAEGCAISVVLEGIRTMTVEVQALVAWSAGSGGYSGRRIVDGISNSRLLLILAVLQKRYGISFHRRDVYVNVVGGMHLGKGSKSGGGSDLAVAVGLVSSLVGIPVRSDTAFVGEVGLLGELRPVHSLDKRISEARRMGFSRIVTPSAASSSQKTKRKGKMHSPGPKEVSAGGIKQLMCDNVLDAINCGLVSSLPTKQTRSGPKLIKPKHPSKSNGTRMEDRTKSFDMSDLDIILDDEDDMMYE